MECIAILGGTFDPPHKGHLAMVQFCMQQCAFDRAYFVPCGIPVNKTNVTTFSARKSMLELLIKNQPNVFIDDCENNRDNSYTIDTLLYFRNKFPNAKLFFLLGSDAYADLPNWHKWKELLAVVHLMVFSRDNEISNILPYLASYEKPFLLKKEHIKTTNKTCNNIFHVNKFAIDISSAEVRNDIELLASPTNIKSDDKSIKNVANFIAANSLYNN